MTLTDTQRDTARRASFDRKIRNASPYSDVRACLFEDDDDMIYLRGEWNIATLKALLDSYLEGK